MAGGIIAHQHGGKSRPHAVSLHHGRHLGGDLDLHGLGELLAIEQNGGHVHLSVRDKTQDRYPPSRSTSRGKIWPEGPRRPTSTAWLASVVVGFTSIMP